jgi:predicted MFS family arabinose efflux permease
VFATTVGDVSLSGSPFHIVAVSGLVFCAELGQAMLTPLLPELGRAFRLGPAEAGVVVSAATIATLAAAVPAGLLAARIGALPIALAAGMLIAIAAALQALATDLSTFLAGRLVFGIGFAAIWTAGVALLSGTDTPRSALGATMAAGGLAHLVGPPLSGMLGDTVDRSLPFWLLAAAATAVTLLAAGARAGDQDSAPALGLRAVSRAASRETALRSATMLIALVGVLTGLVPLVVPLLLDSAGFSSGGIGAVFAASSLVWVAASALAVRTGARAVTIGAAAGGLAFLAAVSLMPVVSVAGPCVVAFVVVRAGIQAPLATISYELGARGAREAGVAIGTVMGLLNVVWAAGATAAPLLGGAVLAGAGARWVFVLLALACAAAGLAMRLESRRAVANPASRRSDSAPSACARHAAREWWSAERDRRPGCLQSRLSVTAVRKS